MAYCVLMLLALLIELAAGWPRWLFTRIKHPVVWIGSLIAWLDNSLNNTHRSHLSRQLAGALTTLVVVTTSVGIACVISDFLPDNITGFIIEALIASSLLASRSLYQHVNAVASPLSDGDHGRAREALGHIVGRETSPLAEPGIAGAAIETLAENASDGVFAPLFWGLLLGLPGITAYKAINTLDSMIGHRSDKYLAFGFCSAKLDDIVNIIPARLSAVLIAIAGGSLLRIGSIARDAGRHRSPNAGWPEAAMAYALRIRLSGPRTYNDKVTDEPWINEQSPLPQSRDLDRSLQIYARSLLLTLILLLCVIAIELVNE